MRPFNSTVLIGRFVQLYPCPAYDRSGGESSRVESGNETSEDEMDAEDEDALHYEMEEEEKKVTVHETVFKCRYATSIR